MSSSSQRQASRHQDRYIYPNATRACPEGQAEKDRGVISELALSFDFLLQQWHTTSRRYTLPSTPFWSLLDTLDSANVLMRPRFTQEATALRNEDSARVGGVSHDMDRISLGIFYVLANAGKELSGRICVLWMDEWMDGSGWAK